MKSYYDLKEDGQRKLRKEFAKKYRAYRKGIFLGIVLGLLIAFFLIYYVFTKSYIGLLICTVIYIITTTLLCIDENLAFNKWLKVSKKLEK